MVVGDCRQLHICNGRNCGKNRVVVTNIASTDGPDDVHIKCFHCRQSPTTAGLPTKVNSAQLPRELAVDIWDRL